MPTSLQKLADIVESSLVGNGQMVIHAARPLHLAAQGEITLLEDPKKAADLEASQASAAVVPRSFAGSDKCLLQADDPLMAFVAIFQHLHGQATLPPAGIDPRAAVHDTARVGLDSSVQPFAVVGSHSTIGARCVLHSGAVIGNHCQIGDDVILYPNATLYDHTVVGDRVIIHANAVIGADGFGYRTRQGRHVKVPHLGNVIIEADVEIGAGATIDRGTFHATRIGAGTKIDNLVQIGHNVIVGRHCIIVAQVGISGSTELEDFVTIGGQAGVIGHVRLAKGVQVGAQSGVTKSLPADATVFGTPAAPLSFVKRLNAYLQRLPLLFDRAKRLEERVAKLEESQKESVR
jgi:UDP-3-O-[3-hydroxymyristoyl] glucosamine N-acyltransferase